MPTRAQVSFHLLIKPQGVASTTTLMDKLAASFRRNQKANQQLATQFRQGRRLADGYATGLTKIATNLGKAAAAGVGLYALGTTYAELIRLGVEWNKTLEIGALGIASVAIAVRQYNDAQGEALPLTVALDAAQRDSAKQLRLLRVAGLQTAATTRQLVSAYQEAVGVGSAYNLTLSQIREVTIATTQAALTLGLPLFQINQEIRALLSGDIDRNARVAKALAITPTDIRLAQERNDLFGFLVGKLEAFRVAGEKAQHTYAIILSNLQEAVETFAGLAGIDFFTTLRDGLEEFTTAFFDLQTADVAKEFQGLVRILRSVLAQLAVSGIEVLNRLMDGFKTVSAIIDRNVIGSLRSLLREIGNVVNASVQLGIEIGTLVAQLAGMVTETGTVQSGMIALRDAITSVANVVKGLRTTLAGSYWGLLAAKILGVAIVMRGLASIVGSLVGIFARMLAPIGLLVLQTAQFARVQAALGAAMGVTSGAAVAQAVALTTLQRAWYGLTAAMRANLVVTGLTIAAGLFALSKYREAQENIKHEQRLQEIRDRRSETETISSLLDQYQEVHRTVQDTTLTGHARLKAIRQQEQLERELVKHGIQIKVGAEATEEALQSQLDIAGQYLQAQIKIKSNEAGILALKLYGIQKERDEIAKKVGGFKGSGSNQAALNEAEDRIRRVREEMEALGLEIRGSVDALGALQPTRTTMRPRAPEVDEGMLRQRYQEALNQAQEDVRRLDAIFDERLAYWDRQKKEGLVSQAEWEAQSAQLLVDKQGEMQKVWYDFLVKPAVQAYSALDKGGRGLVVKSSVDKAISGIEDDIRRQATSLQNTIQDERFGLIDAFSKLLDIKMESRPITEQIARVFSEWRTRYRAEIITLKQMNIQEGDPFFGQVIDNLKNKDVQGIIDKEFSRIVDRTRAYVEEINQLQESGALQPLTARRRLSEQYRIELPQLQALQKQLRTMGADNPFSPLNSTLQEVNRRLAETEQLARKMDIALQDLQVGAIEGFREGLLDTLKKIGIEIKKVDDALRNLALVFATAVRDVAASLLSQEITQFVQNLLKAGKAFDVLKSANFDSLAPKVVGPGLGAPLPGLKPPTDLPTTEALAKLGQVSTATAVKEATLTTAREAGSVATTRLAETMFYANLVAGSYAQGIRQVAQAMLESQIAKGVFSAAGAAGGGPIDISYASGGFVSGPGTWTSDSISARLSNGEYVINARAVQAVGREYLDALNSIHRPLIRRPPRAFAAGGLVGGSEPGGGQFGITIGLEDGLVARAIQSRDGQAAMMKVLNVRRKNARQILNG